MGETDGFFQKAFSITKSKVVPDEASVANVVSRFGPFHLDTGQPEEAEGCMKQELKFDETLDGPDE